MAWKKEFVILVSPRKKRGKHWKRWNFSEIELSWWTKLTLWGSFLQEPSTDVNRGCDVTTTNAWETPIEKKNVQNSLQRWSRKTEDKRKGPREAWNQQIERNPPKLKP